jgi:hypothetical protein
MAFYFTGTIQNDSVLQLSACAIQKQQRSFLQVEKWCAVCFGISVPMLTSIEVITGAKSQDSCLRAAYL